MGTSLHLDCTTSAGAGQAKVKRRAVAVLVYLAAISGRSFFSAVVSTLEEVTARLRELTRPGDLLLTVGAGAIYRAGEALVESGVRS